MFPKHKITLDFFRWDNRVSGSDANHLGDYKLRSGFDSKRDIMTNGVKKKKDGKTESNRKRKKENREVARAHFEFFAEASSWTDCEGDAERIRNTNHGSSKNHDMNISETQTSFSSQISNGIQTQTVM